MKDSDNRNFDLYRRLERLENDFRNLNSFLTPYFLIGRLRTDRKIPTSSSDVFPSDLIYDRIVTDGFEYILINNAGVLEWRQIALNSF